MVVLMFWFSFIGGLIMLFVSSINLMYLFIFIIILISWICCLNYQGEFILSEIMLYSDGLSNSLVFLTFWVGLLMLLSSNKIYKFSEYSSFYIFLIYMLNLFLLITFFIGDYLYFYFFFEITLIPTFMIIMGWGYQPERLQAGIYFIFYTLTASLPLLVSILFLYNIDFNLFYFLFIYDFKNFSGGLMINLMMIMAFLVKLPMFMFHLWLPKAHVEAPVAGSMILAGVLLKLGGYGLLRVSKFLIKKLNFLNSYFVGLSIVGMILVGFICCRLNDLKSLVAYSSVAHMSMVICGVLSFYIFGFQGSLMMMISHGLSSSGLFCIVNMYYERSSSRSFYMNKGLISIFPIFCGSIFMLSAANIAAPPSINLISEIFLMASIVGFDCILIALFSVGSFLGAVFTIFMFSYTQHGKLYNSYYSSVGSYFREFHILMLHIFPIYILVLKTELFIML
uniref:NADH-ubiquinone oxidoreductase chain 4 n=1 Tax=Paranurophorus simplex TaxID=2583953 RepID=A0A6H0EXR3_9HEXA|nr:NADH dehydrogenase subunit 4 [Paranurophorus simplex]